MIHYGLTLSYAVSVESHPLLLGAAIFLFALGTVAPTYLFAFKSFKETRRYASKYPGSHINSNIYKGILILTGLLILWIAVVYIRTGSPLLSSIAYRSWVASNSWPMLGITLFLPFMTLAVLVYGYAQQEDRLWRAGLFALVVALGFMILTSRRYPVLDFGIWTICLVSYLKFYNYSEITRLLVVSGAAAIPFFVVISLIRNPRPGALENTIMASVRLLRNRILLSEATAVNYIFTAFPQRYDYFGTEFLLDRFISILPGYGHNQSFGEELYNAVLAGSGGFLPPTYIGRMYISLGIFGFAGLFAWGFVLQTVFIMFVRSQKTPLTVVIFAVTSGLLGRSLIQGFLSPVNRIKYLTILLLPLVLLALKLPAVSVIVSREY